MQRWSTTRCRFKAQRAPKGGQEATHHQIAAQQFLGIDVIVWARQFFNCGDGCLQVLCQRMGVDALVQGGGILCLVKENLSGFG